MNSEGAQNISRPTLKHVTIMFPLSLAKNEYVPRPRLIFGLSFMFVGLGLAVNAFVNGDGGDYTIIGTSLASIGTFGLGASVFSLSNKTRDRLLAMMFCSTLISASLTSQFGSTTIGVVSERILSPSILASILLALLVTIESFEDWITPDESPEERILQN